MANSPNPRRNSLHVVRHEDSNAETNPLEILKEELREEWFPEYEVEDFKAVAENINTVSERQTGVSLDLCLEDKKYMRKTKILCTMGPKCWSEEQIDNLIDAGLDVARLNFSHGDHDAHGSVFDRIKMIAERKKSHTAILLDTKGPEIRTAMLKDHQAIDLVAGQPIIVEAVGDRYTEFEGYKNEQETRIGLSYAKLCQSVVPGNVILLADGVLSIRVEEILNETELRGTVMNSKTLSERKNCNLPGVKVDIPVLTEKDINDLQNFGCKKGVDFVAASFVQSKADVEFIRRILDEAGGQHIQIISKIENEEGLKNFDEILEVTDGVMVARGDLGMEIPSEKVPAAQKLIITKCNVAGKFVICATQMLESMCGSPRPTRAEMTDVANAVYDGVDAVMLSGETANGDFPSIAVSTMASIVANAEIGVMYQQQFTFIRYWNMHPKGDDSSVSLSEVESACSAASKIAASFQPPDGEDGKHNCFVVVHTENGHFADLVSKYRPAYPVFVACPDAQVLRTCRAKFGQLPIKMPMSEGPSAVVAKCIKHLSKLKHDLHKGVRAIFVAGDSITGDPFVRVINTGMKAPFKSSLNVLTPSGTFEKNKNFVVAKRSTNTNIDMITKPLDVPRCTKIICTMGPCCWDEANLTKLFECGLDVARFNFSHGDHAGHQEVLDRFRAVAERVGLEMQAKHGLAGRPMWSTLLDTKGPEIRTAMLKDHKPIFLEAGHDITIHAVGEDYTSWEGYQTSDETVIGLSYAKLCQSVKPGNVILLADGSVSIEITAIVSDTVLKGRIKNSAKLAERKNCNLPGVKVDLPVLTEKDINDLVSFACKNKMDFVAASFVQSKEDVQFIRSVLDQNGGENISIICKIENAEGLRNFDEILEHTDGIMVARGDLGMEIPPHKVPFAQKMMITKCNLAGKFVICATQMLESMCSNPRPTRAEMTDVANAVLDGTDCVMLSGETAGGQFPLEAVSTMAAICRNAEAMVDSTKRYDYLHSYTPKPMMDAEAVCSAAVQCAEDMGAKAIIVLTTTGRSAALAAKYKPNMPIFVCAKFPEVARQSRTLFGTHGVMSEAEMTSVHEAIPQVQAYCKMLEGGSGLHDGDQVVFITRRAQRQSKADTQRLIFRTAIVGQPAGEDIAGKPPRYEGDKTVFWRSTKVGMDTLLDKEKYKNAVRKTKIVCTMGPKCWSEEQITKLLAAGMNVARFNFSHGDHEAHYSVLERLRKIADEKNDPVACFLDTKGPEIRTAMLKDHKAIDLVAGQTIIVEAVGDRYTEFEGHQTEQETRIGLSYAKLCQSVVSGNMILLADGSISIRVEEILNDTELRGTVMNSKTLSERKNCNLPGVKVDIPVLTEKDINDLQNFCCKHKMDFVAASFVQSKEDVLLIRRTLDEAGGQGVGIISKIENQEGLKNYDEILEVTDGIMVARGDLGMEIPPEKVALAQKYMVTRANISGRFVICATQMLESMCDSYTPTRAEMTDVANAVMDGVDAVMLSGETANGINPANSVDTMARICRSAEIGVNYSQAFEFIRKYTPKPVGTIEASVSTLAKNANDIMPGMVVAFSECGHTARLVAKYRPTCPVLIVTSNPVLAKHCQSMFALNVMKLDKMVASLKDMPAAVQDALNYGVEKGLCSPGKEVVVMTSSGVTKAGASGAAAPQRRVYVTTCPGTLSLEGLGKMAPSNSKLNLAGLDGGSAGLRFAESPTDAGNEIDCKKTLNIRSTVIDLPMLFESSLPVRKTNIIATIGPASSSEAMIGKLLDAGMDVARFNMALTSASEARLICQTVRKVAAAKNKICAILVDTAGPQIHTCNLVDHPETMNPIKSIELVQGEILKLTAYDPSTFEPFAGWKTATETRISINYPDLCQQVKAGMLILIDDGNIRLEITKVAGEEIEAKVIFDAVLKGRQACNVMGLATNLPTLTTQDRMDLEAAVDMGVDVVAASFVQRREDILYVKDMLTDMGGADIKVVAKIETVAALQNLDSIITEADGVMIARGNLGTFITPEKVFLAQSMITTKANFNGKFIMLARHCLHSMVKNPRPTRAEMTDVANAVLDGVHGLMLSAETAVGDFPVDCVATLDAIIRNAEAATNYTTHHTFIRDVTTRPFTTAEAVAAAAAKSPLDGSVAMVLVFSETGRMANLISKFKSPCPILVVTTDSRTAACTRVEFAQYPCLVEHLGSARDLGKQICMAVAKAREMGIFEGGAVTVVHGANEPDAEIDPVVSLWSAASLERGCAA